tara:strand:- start:343 stop:798 length:456 start_codon:yes stop_codon:yes gene_type:complete
MNYFIDQKLINDIFQKSMIIISLAGLFLYIRTIIIQNSFIFPEDKKMEVDKVIVIEKFESKMLENIENKNRVKKMKQKSFCNNLNMKKKCGNFSNKVACTSVECCVWASNKKSEMKCVPGDANGPKMKKDPNLINYDEYYYLDKEKKKVII